MIVSRFPTNKPIKAVWPGAESGDKEKEEAVDDSQFAFVLDGPEAVRRVHFEISERHLAAGKKRSDAGEQTQRDQQAAAELNDPSVSSSGL